MKILTVVYSLNKGGTQRVAQVFAEAYSELSLDSKVLVTREGGIREKELSEKGIFFWLGMDYENIQQIKDWNPDVIHIHSHGVAESEFNTLLPIAKGKKIIETNVFSIPSPWANHLYISFQLSTWCHWLFQIRAGSQELKSAIVPNPVNVNAFRRCSDKQREEFRKKHEIGDEAILLGRIGQNSTKWSSLLIDSFSSLRKNRKNLKLMLVNPPQSIINLARKSNFYENILIIDKIIGDRELSIAYSAMDIFALATEQGESFGLVSAESMLCETPVVALSTPWGGNSQCEVVGHMQGGLIATSKNGFTKAIEELINNRELRQRLGKQGRQRVIKKYDYIKVAKLAIDSIQKKNNPASLQALSDEVVKIYKDAFDKPNPITVALIKSGRYLGLTKFTTGYEPLSMLPKQVFSKIRRLL